MTDAHSSQSFPFFVYEAEKTREEREQQQQEEEKK